MAKIKGSDNLLPGIDLGRLDIDEIFEKVSGGIEKVEEDNKKKFIEKYCENRDFLKNILENNIYYYNLAIKEKIGGVKGLFAAGFMQEVNEEFYKTDNIDIFLNEIEEDIKKSIQKDIKNFREKIEELELLYKGL